MHLDPICTQGAVDLAARIRRREVSALAVIDAHLARIEAVNPVVNAITMTLTVSARDAARAVDRDIAAGRQLGPLAGVPFTIKENIDLAGTATTWGLTAFASQTAAIDAPMVTRLREAGAIPLARTNLPDWAFRWDVESSHAGRTLNPWDAARTPGGTSGGEAAALAAGMTPLGLGNDLGGSLRVPAQMCGIATIRPSRGRVANHAVTQPWPEPIAFQMTNCQGPMARKVADLRLALELISARDPRDPRWVPAPFALPALPAGARVAVVRDPAGGGIDPQVRAGIDRAAGWLADAGYEVVDAEPPAIPAVAQCWFDAIWADVGALWPSMAPITGPGELGFVNAALAAGVFKPVDQAAQRAAWSAIYQHASAWNEFFAQHPVVLSPVSCQRPWLINDDHRRVADIAHAMRMVVAVNILGLPGCVVPVGSDEGLPQAVQLIGARFNESWLLDAAAAIEARVPALTPINPRPAHNAGT